VKILLCTGVFVAVLLGKVSLTQHADPYSPQDSAAIEALVSSMTDAWNHADAASFSRRFAEDGGFTNVVGAVYYGRESFQQRHAEILNSIYKGSVLKQTIGKMRFIRPDVAIVDINVELTGHQKLPPGIRVESDGAIRAKLQLVLVKENGEWWITAYHNVAVTPLPLRP
jgi:uncharacterized protein (TIGR02246 family)